MVPRGSVHTYSHWVPGDFLRYEHNGEGSRPFFEILDCIIIMIVFHMCAELTGGKQAGTFS